MPVSQLPRDEIARRIKAARELRRMSQSALAGLMAQDGIGLHDLGQIERQTRQMQLVHQDAILRHLELPERWLTAGSVDEIVGAALSDRELAEILGPEVLAAYQVVLASGAQGKRGLRDRDRPEESSGENGA